MFELGLLVGELGHAEMAEPAVVRLKVGQRGEERPENVESNKTGLKPVSKTAHIFVSKLLLMMSQKTWRTRPGARNLLQCSVLQ